MKEYKEHYVAFIDIIGFKNIIKDSSCDEIYRVFEHLAAATMAGIEMNGKLIEAFNGVKHYIMSDSIVLYIEADIPDAFAALAFVCLKLQQDLILSEKPILLRGGIAKGNLFVEGNIIYGKGLTDAYMLENSVASVPRIVFNKALLDEAMQGCKELPATLCSTYFNMQDIDELYFIRYLCIGFVYDKRTCIEEFKRAFMFSQKELDNTYDKSIREKHLWLKKYIVRECAEGRDFLKTLPNGEELLNMLHISY